MLKKTISLHYKNGIKYAGDKSRTLVSILTGATTKRDVGVQLEKIEAVSKLNKNELPDIISDLSLQKSNASLYTHVIRTFPDFIVSTLPIYQCEENNGIVDQQELLEVALGQIESGVGMITIHPTPSIKLMQLAQRRIVPWTSRGGAMVMKDLSCRKFKTDNIYLKIIDEIAKAAATNNVVISIGASFRSANIFDSLDECQIEEFKAQKEIADYLSDKGVQIIIEGPGHSSPQKLKHIAKYYQEMAYPIMPLGPIPTDNAIGQDHISSSIGAVLLGMYNCVDILTSVTREEHTGKIPSIESSIEAIKAAKVAAHIIDINKLDDYDEDEIVVKYRAEHQTCVYGKKNAGCSRCADVCPLRFEFNNLV